MQMHHLETPYQYYAKVRGHLRSEGSRGQIHQKCYKSSILYIMIITSMHMLQFETLYNFYVFKSQSGFISGHRGQTLI